MWSKISILLLSFGGELSIIDRHLSEAMDELVVKDGELTRRLLGVIRA